MYNSCPCPLARVVLRPHARSAYLLEAHSRGRLSKQKGRSEVRWIEANCVAASIAFVRRKRRHRHHGDLENGLSESRLPFPTLVASRPPGLRCRVLTRGHHRHAKHEASTARCAVQHRGAGWRVAAKARRRCASPPVRPYQYRHSPTTPSPAQ